MHRNEWEIDSHRHAMMIEHVQTDIAAHIWRGVLICVVVLLIGFSVDFGLLPWLQRRFHRMHWHVSGAIIHALRFQTLAQALIIGTIAIIINSGYATGNLIEPVRVCLILTILVFAVGTTRLATGLVRMSLKQHHQDTISIINVLIRVVSILLILTLALALFGVSIAPLVTIIAGSSLGLSLALRDPLANLFAGLQILAAGQLQPGGYVQLSTGQSGYVVDIRWSDTTIRQLSNNILVVPNVILTTTLLVNYDLPEPEQSLEIAIEVPAASDLSHVERVTLDVANAVLQHAQGAVKEWHPFIRYAEFTATHVTFIVTLRVHGFMDQRLVKHEFIRQVQQRYLQEQIDVLSAKGEV